jgi:hypothetical protein
MWAHVAKLSVSHPVKKFLTCHGYIIGFKGTSYWALSTATSIQTRTLFLSIILTLCSHTYAQVFQMIFLFRVL